MEEYEREELPTPIKAPQRGRKVTRGTLIKEPAKKKLSLEHLPPLGGGGPETPKKSSRSRHDSGKRKRYNSPSLPLEPERAEGRSVPEMRESSSAQSSVSASDTGSREESLLRLGLRVSEELTQDRRRQEAREEQRRRQDEEEAELERRAREAADESEVETSRKEGRRKKALQRAARRGSAGTSEIDRLDMELEEEMEDDEYRIEDQRAARARAADPRTSTERERDAFMGLAGTLGDAVIASRPDDW